MSHLPPQAGVIAIQQRDVRLHNESPTTAGWGDGHKESMPAGCPPLHHPQHAKPYKPQEDLQFLEVATGSRPCTAFVRGMLHEEVTWCLPLAWHSTDPTFTPCRSKGCRFNITSPLTDTWCPEW